MCRRLWCVFKSAGDFVFGKEGPGSDDEPEELSEYEDVLVGDHVGSRR